jgi:pteridine reductase
LTLAVVTGGTRRVGAAIAARLAAAGYDLALHSHAPSEPEPALAEAIARAGVRAEHFTADLADSDAIDTLLPAIAATFGAVPDCLVNSASMFGEDRWADVTSESMLRHFEVNAVAPARLAQQFAALLGPEGRGVVVNLLDQRVRMPPDDQAAYTVSKMALAEITRAQAAAFAPQLRMCGVAPGLTLPTGDYDAAQLERLAAMMPLRRLPTPAQIAEAVAYLAAADAVTGQILYVDGGAALQRYERDFVNLGR